MTQRRTVPDSHAHRPWWSWLGYTLLLSFSIWLIVPPLLEPSPPLAPPSLSPPAVSLGPSSSAAPTASARSASAQPAGASPSLGPGVTTRPIETIRVGERVLSENPEIDRRQRSDRPTPDWSHWLHLSLQMPQPAAGHDPGGAGLSIELLRPESWVREHLALVSIARPLVELAVDSRSDQNTPLDPDSSADPASSTGPAVPSSPLRCIYREIAEAATSLEFAGHDMVAMTVQLELTELGAVGTAIVTGLEPCPAILVGRGEVVTGTFAHPPSHDVLDVRWEGEPNPIGVTSNHLFWSVDQERFLAIGEMQIGERVQTYHGETKRIEQQLPRPGPQTVHNLEVFGEHVYHVGHQGVVAHNAYANSRKPGLKHLPLKQGDIDQYRYFSKRPGDRIEGHELWQSANTLAYGLGGRTGPLGRLNPALALSSRDHQIVNRIQTIRIPTPSNQTAIDNISANISVLRESQNQGVNITDRQIKEIAKRSVRFYERLKSQGLLTRQ